MPSRRIIPVLAISLALIAVAPGAVRAQGTEDRRVFLLAVEQDGIDAWGVQPALQRVFTQGAGGLISTRSADDVPERARLNGYAALGAGARAKTPDTLATALRNAGIPFVATDTELATFMGAASAPASPTNFSHGVWLVAEPGAREADVTASALLAERRPDDAIIAFTVYRANAGRVFLGAVSILGPGFERGTLRSATTRRDRLVALTDIAPTVLSLFGEEPPPSMTGREIAPVSKTSSLANTIAFEHDLTHAAHIRSPMLRTWLIFSMVASLIFAAGAIFGRRLRWVVVLLTVSTSAPFALLLEPALPGATSLATSSLLAGAIAFATAGASILAFGSRRALGLICALTAVVVLADLILGGPLASRAPISYLLAEGSRFYGIGNELMGVLIGALLVAVTVAYEEAPRSRWTSVGVPLALAGATWLMASPSAGAKFGSVMTAVPAFGLVAARAGGRRVTIRLLMTLETGAALITGIVYAIDRLRPAAERSHIAGASSAAASGTLWRKMVAALRLLALSIWMSALIVFVGAVFVAARARPSMTKRLFIDVPLLRVCLQAGALAVVSAIAFNDAGTVAAAIIALFTGTYFFAELLEAKSEA